MKLQLMALLTAALAAVGANAQQSGNATPEKKRASNRLMEEVVVSAQKREENSQDIPIAISAFSEEKLDAFGIETTADLQKITPGLTFT